MGRLWLNYHQGKLPTERAVAAFPDIRLNAAVSDAGWAGRSEVATRSESCSFLPTVQLQSAGVWLLHDFHGLWEVTRLLLRCGILVLGHPGPIDWSKCPPNEGSTSTVVKAIVGRIPALARMSPDHSSHAETRK